MSKQFKEVRDSPLEENEKTMNNYVFNLLKQKSINKKTGTSFDQRHRGTLTL